MRQSLQNRFVQNSVCKLLPEAITEFKVVGWCWNTPGHCSCGAFLCNCAIIENVFNKIRMDVGLDCLNDSIFPQVFTASNITKLSQFMLHMKKFPECLKVLTSLEIISFLYDESIINDWEHSFYTNIINSGKRTFSYKQTTKIIKINKVIYSYFRIINNENTNEDNHNNRNEF